MFIVALLLARPAADTIAVQRIVNDYLPRGQRMNHTTNVDIVSIRHLLKHNPVALKEFPPNYAPPRPPDQGIEYILAKLGCAKHIAQANDSVRETPG